MSEEGDRHPNLLKVLKGSIMEPEGKMLPEPEKVMEDPKGWRR